MFLTGPVSLRNFVTGLLTEKVDLQNVCGVLLRHQVRKDFSGGK